MLLRSGAVTFEKLSFRRPGQPEVLKDINPRFHGTFVGIVGQSGSAHDEACPVCTNPVKVDPDDGYDIAKVELYSLRRQIGIVPQDPLLFSGTVSENIALTNPDASSEDIRATRLANAHDFIVELPSGYSTPGVSAAQPSGQRQWRSPAHC